jgi:hypothetical protein
LIFAQHLPRFLAAAVAVALPLIAGCGGGPNDRSPVRGSVSYDGQPVDKGGIAFLPEGEGEEDHRVRATGQIHDGRYDLDALKGPFPGKYRVQIYWKKKTGQKVPGEGEGLKDETLQVIPSKYNTESELIVEIKPGRNTFDFNLAK